MIMTAEAPSYTALKISDTSALVGTGERSILASICVTTIKGTSADRHFSDISFCILGSSHNGTAFPRSPLAMTSISVSGRISSTALIPSLFSILAKRRQFPVPHSSIAFLTSKRSSFPRTKGCITSVTPASRAHLRLSRSCLVRVLPVTDTPSKAMLFLLSTVPPVRTDAEIIPGSAASSFSKKRRRILPSSIRAVIPGS